MMARLCILLLFACGLPSLFLGAQEEVLVSTKFQIFLWPDADLPSGYLQASLADSPEKANYHVDKASGDIIWENGNLDWFLPIVYRPTGGERTDTIRLYQNRLSTMYDYHGPPELTFYRKSETPQIAESIFTPMAKAKIPESEPRVTLIFFPKQEGEFNVMAIAYNSVPKGKVLIYNLTRSPLACTLGESVFDLPVGEPILRDLNFPNNGYYQPLLVASREDDGQWKRRLVRKLPLRHDERAVFLLYTLPGEPDACQLVKLNLEDEGISAAESSP